MDTVIGIDLSGLSYGTKGSTALAELSVEDPPRLVDLHLLTRGRQTDAELLEWVDTRHPRVVAIDAPLTLPHGITCQDPACERCTPPSSSYLTRDVDRMAGGMSMVMIAGIAFRGIYLARRLKSVGYDVIEIYPAAAYRAFGLLSKAERRDPTRVAEAIERRVLGARPETGDERDAVTAAFVAVTYELGRATAITGQDGTIWMPESLGQSKPLEIGGG